jgi:integrase
MRRNEILALRWIDIDLDAAMISISRSAFAIFWKFSTHSVEHPR